LAWTVPARAQKPPAKAPVHVTPPVVENSTDVPYPLTGRGDAVVVLEFVVDKDGRVSSAVVSEGSEPFAAQARRVVLKWRFRPALRDGTPVAARIRARVEFRQPSLPPPSAKPTAPERASTSSATEPPIVINVHGRRPEREIGQTTLSAADVRDMPGAFGDPFRAIEALPGVLPVVSGLPFFYIRGAPPNDNAYYVDGIRVPLLFHVGIGEGVIHPALVDHVDFYPGAAPAAYGRTAGAVIAAETRAPAATAHGDVNVRLVDAGALLESPLDEGRGSALVAGRYGYPGPILGAVTSNVKLGYWDYQARATWRVAPRDTLGVFAFGSHDYLGTANTNNGVTGPIVEALGSDFHRVDLRYDRALEDGRLRVATTLGYTSQGGSLGDKAAVATVTDLSGQVRLEVEKRVSHAARVRAGVDVGINHYAFAEGQAPSDESGLPAAQVPTSADPPPINVTWGLHADVVWRLSPRVEIVPGARVDLFESKRPSAPLGAQATTTAPAIDPRLAARVTLARGVTYIAALGLSHQYPALRVGAVPAILLSVPGFPFGDTELQTVAQASQGIELELPADFTLTTTGFLSDWSGLTDLTSDCIQIMPPSSPPGGGNGPKPAGPYACPNDKPAHGYAYGVELLLRRPLSKRLTGWLSYTLSRSTRDEHFVTLTGGDALATVASDYDRTHVVNAIFSYDLGHRWRAGARFVLLSGTPYSNLAGNVPVQPYNGYRDPPFFRLDVRLEKRWPLGKTGYIAFIAEGQNVTLSKEVTPLGLSCEGNQTAPNGPSTTHCQHSAVGPITIPSLGAEAVF
jgi:TonB family protein